MKELKKQGTTILIAVIATIAVLAVATGMGYAMAKSSVEAKWEKIVEEKEEEIEKIKDEILVVDPVTPKVELSTLDAKVQSIGELATVEYLYTNAAKFSDAKELFKWKISFTEKAFVARWDGIIKAGINLEGIAIGLDEEKKEIKISIPQAVILSHEIDESSLETLDESSGLFNPISTSDAWELTVSSKEAMEKRALENGLLDKAMVNAQEIIAGLVCADPAVDAGGYQVIFEVMK